MIGPRCIDNPQERPALQHRKSTKLLIRQYEAIGAAVPLPLRDTSLTRVRSTYRHQGLDEYCSRASPSLATPRPRSNPKKERSPLRQSFHNLLSVLKKGKAVTSKHKSYDKLYQPPGKASCKEPATKAPVDIPEADHTAPSHSGALIYLTNSSQFASELSWTSCTATLEGSKFIVSWFSSDGYPCIHEIHLSRCTDVRSLSLASLDAPEMAALPSTGNSEEFKIFEILFEGRARERFAAACVRDRARWISTIWDAILPSQDTKPTRRNEFEDVPLPPTPTERDNNNSPAEAIIPLASPTHSEKFLPPVPQKPILSALTIPGKLTNLLPGLPTPIALSPISPSVYSTASPRPSSTRTSSPSIANLGQLSVVKQRLAQIEKGNSQSSDSSELRSPVSSSRRDIKLGSSRPTSPLSSRGGGTPKATLSTPVTFSSASPQPFSAIERFSTENGSARGGTTPKATLNTSVTFSLASPQPFNAIEPSSVQNDSRCAENGSCSATPLLEGITDIKGVLGGQSGCPTIHQVLLGVDHRLVGTNDVLVHIQEVLQRLEERNIHRLRRSSDYERGDADVLKMLQTIKAHLTSELPAINSKVSDLQFQQLANVGAAQPSSVSSSYQPVDLAPVHARLEELMKMCNSNKFASIDAGGGCSSELARIVLMLEEEKENRGQQALQQADSVRYLNELNTWLEAFVNNGTSQIQGLASSIDQLCADLGSQRSGTGSNLLHDIRQLVLGMKTRDQNLASLQAGVGNLLGALNSEGRMGLDSHVIAGMMENQNRNQETMFRAFTNEISGEIKGERLRFVEAMKEATAINVQMHVEQFKKELGREVMGMTKEVQRLHRDKQDVENQIADLFAFYSKQKSAGMSVSSHSVPQVATRPHGHSRKLTYHSAQSRPLPLPRGTY